jgi:protein TorT
VIYEASGYSKAGLMQQERILNQRCSTGNLDAVLLAAVDKNGLHESLRRLRKQHVLVVDFVNGYDSAEVDARAFLDNYHLGKSMGEEIKNYLITSAKKTTPTLLWIPGPQGPDWVERSDQGFNDALRNQPVTITMLPLKPHYREQTRDLRAHLKSGKHYDLIVGTGPTSVAAYQLKQERIIPANTPVFASYTTPDVVKLLDSGEVLASASNEPKLQGRIGVALAVGMLEKLPMPYQVGPEPVLLRGKIPPDAARQ